MQIEAATYFYYIALAKTVQLVVQELIHCIVSSLNSSCQPVLSPAQY